MLLKGKAEGLKGALIITGIYTATVIGAGFASGAEIEIFFARHGLLGLAGIAVAALLFSLTSVSVLLRVYQSKVKSFGGYLKLIAPSKVAAAIDIICLLFLFSCFCVMVAGAGAVGRQKFEVPPVAACLVFLGVCFVIFCFGFKGIAAASAILAPLMLVGMLVASLCAFFGAAPVWVGGFCPFGDTFFVSAVIYVSYNTLTGAAVLAALGHCVKSKKWAVFAGVGGPVLLCVTAVFMVLVLIKLKGLGEVPMLVAAALLSPYFEFFYALVLVFAMLTTAVSCGFALASRVCSALKVERWLFCLLMCVAALFVAELGFAQLVGRLYGLFGYLGVGLIALILADLYRMAKKGMGSQK